MFNVPMMFLSLACLVAAVALYFSDSLGFQYTKVLQSALHVHEPIAGTEVTVNPIPFSTRAHWMRRANAVLAELSSSPCPFAAFGTVIVNHTDGHGLGDLVCTGLNSISAEGNPTLHGTASGLLRDSADVDE